MSDIATLFARDPLLLSREDIAAIIAHYRQARAQFNLGEKQAGKKPAGPKVERLDLKDLLG